MTTLKRVAQASELLQNLPNSTLRAPILSVTLDKADHILPIDLAEVVGAGGAYLVQKPAGRWEVSEDRPRCKTALSSQVVGKLAEYLLVRGEWPRC